VNSWSSTAVPLRASLPGRAGSPGGMPAVIAGPLLLRVPDMLRLALAGRLAARLPGTWRLEPLRGYWQAFRYGITG
jgi:hypothetical protein